MAEGKPFIKCGQLFDQTDAFEYNQETERLFIDAINESLRWHSNRCSDYKSFLAENGLADFKQKYLPEDIPPVLETIFQRFKLYSVPEKLLKIELAPTNNNNLKSSILLDARSYKRILKIYENIFASHGLVNHKQKVNYICFTYDPKLTTDSATAVSDRILTDLTAHRSVYYAFKYSKKTGVFNIDIEDTTKKIIDFSTHVEPVRIIGSITYLSQLYCWMNQNNIHLKLSKESMVIINGTKTDKEINKEYIKIQLSNVLGISHENIRELYIPSTHGIPYLDCECGRKHVPIYSRAICVDPETLFPVEDGKEGLLNLITPYSSGIPTISLLTTNKAIIENNCPCGRPGKTFRIIEDCGQTNNFGNLDKLEFINEQ